MSNGLGECSKYASTLSTVFLKEHFSENARALMKLELPPAENAVRFRKESGSARNAKTVASVP